MMRLEQPLWLLLLLPALAALGVALREVLGSRASMTFPDASGLRTLTSRASGLWVRWTPTLLKWAVLILAALALARPQTVTRQAVGLAEGIDILLVLDTSTSMQAIDFDPLDRMAAAKNAAREFVRGRASDRIGIVVFGGDPLLTCPLTLDYDALLGFLEDVHPGMTRSNGTAIGDGIAAAVNHLKDSEGRSKVAILLTDGRSNTGLVDPTTAAKTAHTFGIKFYAIGTGKRGEALVPVDDPVFGRRLVSIPDELDEDTLLKVAAETDGKYFRATNLDELKQIYAEIDRLEKTQYERPEIVSFDDLYAYILLPAVFLLGLEMLLTRTWLLRIP
ncbi:MAG: VWA domain-containing protein [Elusimicrobiota bacterium]